jgi:NarL family two-component system response regulator LiaR
MPFGWVLPAADELFNLLRGVTRGEAAMTRAMASRVLKGFAKRGDGDKGDDLTEREVMVLRLVAEGASNAQIAEALCITVNTVKFHLKNILAKLRLENRTQAATYAVRSGLAEAN